MVRAAKYIALLGLFLAAVALAAGSVAARRFGPGAFQASAVAAVLIWLVGSASLAILSAGKTPAARLNAALLAMFVRMSLPLVALVYFTNSDQPLTRDGVVPLLVVHYLAGLVVETFMGVRIAGSSAVSDASAAGQASA